MARLKLYILELWAFLQKTLKTYRTDKTKKQSNMHLQTELGGFLTNNQTGFTLWPEARSTVPAQRWHCHFGKLLKQHKLKAAETERSSTPFSDKMPFLQTYALPPVTQQRKINHPTALSNKTELTTPNFNWNTREPLGNARAFHGAVGAHGWDKPPPPRGRKGSHFLILF